jgi:carboxylesterase type B
MSENKYERIEELERQIKIAQAELDCLKGERFEKLFQANKYQEIFTKYFTFNEEFEVLEIKEEYKSIFKDHHTDNDIDLFIHENNLEFYIYNCFHGEAYRCGWIELLETLVTDYKNEGERLKKITENIKNIENFYATVLEESKQLEEES